MLWFEQPNLALLLGGAAALLITSHLLLRWFRAGWWLAQSAWAAILVIAVVVLRSEWVLAAAAAIPAFAGVLYVQWVHRSLTTARDNRGLASARLRRPSTESCERCSSRVARTIAPLWCVSFIFMTSVTIGKPRHLCTSHARLNSIPATAFSFAFGWWGIPWGLWRTPQTLWRNLTSGGVPVDSALARELYALEQAGTAGWFNFLPGVRSKPIAVLGLILFMVIILGALWAAARG